MSTTDYGALYVGDTIIIPGDIAAEVIGFDFNGNPDARPDNCTVLTDMGRLEGRLGTEIERVSNPSTAPLPEWVEVQRWFSSEDDLIDLLANTGALA